MTLPSSEEDQDPRQRKPRKVMARLRVSLSKTEEVCMKVTDSAT